MASVSTKGQGYWLASIRVWHAAKGKWKRTWKATGIPAASPRAEAQTVADLLQKAADNAGPASPNRGDRKQMASILEDIWRAGNVSAPQVTMTWLDLVDDFLSAQDVSEASQRHYKHRCDKFTAYLGPRAKELVWSITHSDCDGWYRSMISSGLNPSSVTPVFKTVRAVLQRAVHRGIIAQNPAALIRTPSGNNDRRQPFTPAELDAIFAAMKSLPGSKVFTGRAHEWVTLTMLGLFCGMRLGDAAGRVWSDFNLERGTVTFLPQKKRRYGRKVTLPLASPVLAHLKSLEQAGDWLTPNLAVDRNLSQHFGWIVDLAGIEVPVMEKRGPGGKNMRLKSFHSLRHTLVTELARSGVDKQLRQLIADHDDAKTSDRYTHAVVERLAAALAITFPAAAPSGQS